MPRRPTQRYVALLRAINVGGHVVKMDRLRELFTSMRFGAVETFIASGNVLFDSAETDVALMEERIERRLATALGYEVATFIRTPAQMTAVVAHVPFPSERDHGYSVAFMRDRPSTTAADRLLLLRNPDDDLHLHERELYWLCRVRTMESKIWRTPLEKVIGMPATMRNVTTVRKLAEKLSAAR